MPELRIEDHSEEVQEILGKIPNWIVRWGITVLFITVAVVFVGSYFIPYPEKEVLPVKLTSLNAPASIVAQQGNNRISRWFVKDQEDVKEGDVLAVWETEDDYDELLKLKASILQSTQELKPLISSLALPTFKLEIREFNESLQQFILIQNSTRHEQQIRRIEIEIEQKSDYLDLLSQQRNVKEREFGLLEKQFKQDSIYYYDGNYGITKRDYEGALLLFLQQKSSFLQYQASLVELDKSLKDLKHEIQSIQYEREEQISMANKELNKSLFILKGKVEDWELRNLIISPLEGKLDRSSLWSENQLIISGESFASIIPTDLTNVVCIAYADPQTIGAIKVGQKALIKLDGFNSQFFGSIEGTVMSVSSIPLNGEYLIKLQLSNQLTTNENKEIPLIQELTGVAEVITSENRLLNKLIDIGK